MVEATERYYPYKMVNPAVIRVGSPLTCVHPTTFRIPLYDGETGMAIGHQERCMSCVATRDWLVRDVCNFGAEDPLWEVDGL